MFSNHLHHPLFLMPSPPPAPPQPIPKLGQTRCYWTLLSADLDFLYIDPVLRDHLGPQADAIIGKKLLEFVHPDEHASAQQDLGKVLESRTLHGSVTRVRYSRLGRVRARLGYTGHHETFPDEDKVSFDENYMACDLVINWAAEGLVLCFIHAVVDMAPQDNDEHRRTHWTNWCGTPRMHSENGTELYHALFHVSPQGAQGAPPPTRVFQILHNSTDRPTLFSWPGEGYIPADYGRLANDVQIGGANGSDAKTSCTRRYKAQQILNSADGSVRDVESIFIPHGHIIFACHKATPHRPRGHPNSYPLYPTPAQFYDHPPHAPQHAAPYYPPSVVAAQLDPYAAPPPAQQYAHAYHAHPTHHHHVAPLPAQSAGPSSASPAASRGSPSPYPWPTPAPAAPAYPAAPLAEVPPPPRRRATPEASGSAARDAYPAGGRGGGNPPVGVSRCAACKSTSSPEWRKGPSGRKDLCNACGLRFSRARAKKEGVAVQRRRKDPVGEAKSPRRRQNGYGELSPSPSHDYAPPQGEYQYPTTAQQPQQQSAQSALYLGGAGAFPGANGYAAGAAGPSSATTPSATTPTPAPAPADAASSYERSHAP